MTEDYAIHTDIEPLTDVEDLHGGSHTVTVYEGYDPVTQEPTWGILILAAGTPLKEELLAAYLDGQTVVRREDVESHGAAMVVFREERLKRDLFDGSVH